MGLLSQKVKLKVTFNHTYCRAQIELLGQNHIKPNIDLSSSEGVFKKLISISPFSLKKLKRDLNLLLMIKHHLEEIKKSIIKK